jgi:hypothetical protein
MGVDSLKKEIKAIETGAEVLYANKTLQSKLAFVTSVLESVVTQLKTLKQQGIQ